ncbi:GIY-YIG nuclease family protein [Methylobacterium sp. WL120]|uniref:GIY-YIG nuclease family protein n=1 Tax=Methylobacterium sp. WL120 TaxID=2603887 RepID=UPI0011CB8D79|nr:GIY-YIG nuclease family protein [Methylobacterium sp. WL120]TXM53607.1 GIY-YIG nuclease family protein [Methylobacterium sp. WL120]
MASIYKRGRVWWGRVTVRGEEFRSSLNTHHEAIAKERFRKWALDLGCRSIEQSLQGSLGPMSNPRRPDGSIYAIGYDDKVKIGWSAVPPRQRMATLQIGCPEDLILFGSRPGTVAEERQLHREFAHLRIRGEWFRREGVVAAWIEACRPRASLSPSSMEAVR